MKMLRRNGKKEEGAETEKELVTIDIFPLSCGSQENNNMYTG